MNHAPTRQERIRGDRLDLHVEVTGEGPPVILLHGFPENGHSWQRQVGPQWVAWQRDVQMKVMDFWVRLGANRSDSRAIARIRNAAWRKKTRFHAHFVTK